MSIAAMLVATTGVLPPVVGAIIQEAIDVIVILNALRALGGGLEARPSVPGWTAIDAALREEHRELAPSLAGIRALADGLGAMPARMARAELERTRRSSSGPSSRTRSARTATSSRSSPARPATTTPRRPCTARTPRSSTSCGSSIAWSARSRRRDPGPRT